MKRSLMVVAALLLCFVGVGWGLYGYLSSRDDKPLLRADPARLAGQWQNKTASIVVEAVGSDLKVDDALFVRDGRAPRWAEKEPKGSIPRVLEFDGASLKLSSYNESGRSEVVFARTR